ncbi:putative exported protein [Ehrlichia ruminantium]|uniref:Putative exported protein n=1 Tax=Ehrlichia ruminantium TaxID=779 RepID=A0A170S2Q9_EHRRU|nr:putative exported protein [Ehrlichia ruminantium]
MIVPHNTQNYMYLALLYTTDLYSNKDLKKNDQSNTERILINTYITIQVLFFSFTYHNA